MNKTNNRKSAAGRRSESGQAFVLMVIVMLVLLGFTGLAIDGGMALNDRRAGQSGADAAALAGVGAGANWLKTNTFDCSSTAMKNAMVLGAISFAQKNGQTITEKNLGPATVTNGVALEYCQSSPPQVNVHVRISTLSESFLSQAFTGGPLTNMIDAIAQIKAGLPGGGSGGLGLLALDPSAAGALKMTGSGNLGVKDGSIKVNSNNAEAVRVSGSGTLVGMNISTVGGITQTGSGDTSATGTIEIGKNVSMSGSGSFTGGPLISIDGNLTLTGSGSMAAASIKVDGTVTKSGSGSITPAPTTGASVVTTMPDPLAGLAPPTLPAKPGGSCVNYSLSGSGSATIGPGLYCKITVTGSGNLTLTPGLYWITTGDFSQSGSSKITVQPGATFVLENGDVDFSGSGNVTVGAGSTWYIQKGDFSMNGSGAFNAPETLFYLGPQAKGFSLNGSGSMNVSAKTSGTYQGLTLYVDRTNTNTDEVSLTGSGGMTSLNGTYYAPTRPVTFTGSGGLSVVNAQVICKTAEFTGSGDFTIKYDSSKVYQTPSNTELSLIK